MPAVPIGLAAPVAPRRLWAGFTALVNQQAANIGAPRSALSTRPFTPSLRGANYTSCFHDITTGNNTWSGSPNSVLRRARLRPLHRLGHAQRDQFDQCPGRVGQSRHPPFSAAAALWHQPGRHEWRQPKWHVALFMQDDVPLDSGDHFQWLGSHPDDGQPGRFGGGQSAFDDGLIHQHCGWRQCDLCPDGDELRTVRFHQCAGVRLNALGLHARFEQ